MSKWFVVVLTVLIPIGGVIMAQQQEDSARIEMAAKVRELVEQQGPDSAIAYIEDAEDFKEVVTRYYNLTFDLYWREKSLDATVPVAQSGIAYCQTKAEEFAEDTTLSKKLKGMIKVISFNLASFTWPGWQEEGITITDVHQAAGLEAALLNVEVSKELNEGPKPVSTAYWSVGAHHLAAGSYEEAISAFKSAAEYSELAEDNEGKLMNEGYAALVGLLKGEDEAEDEFDDKVARLQKLDTEDSKFYAQQLKDMREFFRED